MNKLQSDIPKKCGTCYHFIVKPDEIALAQHAPSIADCKPGMPHCLGGQVRGACSVWEERAEKGLPMPWGFGAMVESTFSCKLYKPGGPRPRMAGGFNKLKKKTKANAFIIAGLAAIGIATSRSKAGSKGIDLKRAHQIVLWQKEPDEPYALLDEEDNLLWAGEWNEMPLSIPSSRRLKTIVDKDGRVGLYSNEEGKNGLIIAPMQYSLDFTGDGEDFWDDAEVITFMAASNAEALRKASDYANVYSLTNDATKDVYLWNEPESRWLKENTKSYGGAL